MASKYKSEIRDGVIRDLLAKVKGRNYGLYLKRIRLVSVRAFKGQRVDFEFPVSALIGTNGGGKSTILGAAAIAYKAVRPALFFPKSSIGDETMANWSIGYEIIDKGKNPYELIQKSSRFKRAKWARDDLLERPVIVFGIARTVPAGERKEFKRLATANFRFAGARQNLNMTVQEQAAKILGKNISRFQRANITPTQEFYIGGDGAISYSEFHFGAGESSILRMVAAIEAAPENALVLIEEIENGLHPVAVRKMVEYLIDVAARKSIQAIFTTHSEDALLPLPSEAIWSSIDGKVSQGRISIEALRAITGRIDDKMAIFVEDAFAKEWVESIIRSAAPESLDQIGVYGVNGDSQAHSIHLSHRQNPAVQRLKSICILDGNSNIPENMEMGVIKLPGVMPESEVFNFVSNSIADLSLKLAVALHLDPGAEARVTRAVGDVARDNRDAHLLFTQVGEKAGLVPAAIVSSAFIGLWLSGNREKAKRIADFVVENLREANAQRLDDG